MADYSVTPLRQHGFTLIEIMVALLVIAVAYAGVTTAVGQFVDQRLMLMERYTSHRIAWNRLMEQYLQSKKIAVNETDFAEKKGTVELQGVLWQWEITGQKTSGRRLLRYQVDVYNSSSEPVAKSTGSAIAFFTR